MSDNGENLDVYISLCFRDFSIRSNLIDDMLGIRSVVKYDAGEKTPAGRYSSFSFWCADLGIFRVRMLDDAVRDAIAKIDDHRLEISSLSKLISSDNCYLNAAFSIRYFYPSAYFDRDLISDLAEFGLSLSLDCVGKEGEPLGFGDI